MDDIIIEVIYGGKKFIPPVYSLATERHGPWWWRQTAYFIECDTGMRLGPFYEQREARQQLEFIQSL